ncbi:energy-coupling factor transporter transmembrane component T family protein [Vagococcus sp. JNUCC 83]
MKEHQLLGYIPNDTFMHKLSGTTKLIMLIIVSIACMTTYDTRFLIIMSLLSIILFKISKIKWSDISFVVKFIIVFSVLNLLTVFLFSPEYGVKLYGSKHVIIQGIGRYSLTQEQLFYEFNLMLKYFSTVPFVLIFLLTTNPSSFAASLNKIGINYKACYAVSLAIRYIPDIQESYFEISNSQQARGLEMGSNAPILKRIKGVIQIVFPLILSSIERIEVISTAMELRRFGQKKKRTWYSEEPFRIIDIIAIVISILILLSSLLLIKFNGGRFYNPF